MISTSSCGTLSRTFIFTLAKLTSENKSLMSGSTKIFLDLSRNSISNIRYLSGGNVWRLNRDIRVVRFGIVNPVVLNNRSYSKSGNDKTVQKKVKNLHPKGIVPIGEDYGGYDEDKHEEYEAEAQRRQRRIQWIKKICSAIIFSSIFGSVMWARNKKQRALQENIKNCTFLPKDDLFTGANNTFCILGKEDSSDKVVLPASIVMDGTMKFILSMDLRSTDVVVASYPKTGTTWVQQIVYLVKNNLDIAKANSGVLEDRFPFLEYPYPGARSIDKMQSTRLIKTHLPYSFLPNRADQAKIIYIMRNPKDTVVSYYHFSRMLSFLGYTGSFNEFVQKFKDGQLLYSPYFGHMESYLKHKDDPNVLIITYEELSKDPAEIIQKIATFLDKRLTADEITKIAEHTKFEAMAVNPAVNYEHWDGLGIRKKNEAPFFRKGQIGDWRNYFNKDVNDSFDKWVKENNHSNFKFDYNS